MLLNHMIYDQIFLPVPTRWESGINYQGPTKLHMFLSLSAVSFFVHCMN